MSNISFVTEEKHVVPRICNALEEAHRASPQGVTISASKLNKLVGQFLSMSKRSYPCDCNTRWAGGKRFPFKQVDRDGKGVVVVQGRIQGESVKRAMVCIRAGHTTSKKTKETCEKGRKTRARGWTLKRMHKSDR